MKLSRRIKRAASEMDAVLNLGVTYNVNGEEFNLEWSLREAKETLEEAETELLRLTNILVYDYGHQVT